MSVDSLELKDVVPEATPEIQAVCKKLFDRPLEKAIPLVSQCLEMRLSGINAAISNALRRVMLSELTGYYLTFDREIYTYEGCTDPFAFPSAVLGRINGLPLRNGISPEVLKKLVFRLDVENRSPKVKTVFAGDLELIEGEIVKSPFNPTVIIVQLQPGTKIKIPRITVVEGKAYTMAHAVVAVAAGHKPLDIPEHPREATHSGRKGIAQQSGFKVSSMLARPTKYLIRFTIPAALRGSTHAMKLPVMACDNIIGRLRNALSALAVEHKELSDKRSYWLGEETRSFGTLVLEDENQTIGELLHQMANDMYPDIDYSANSWVQHERNLKYEIRYDKVPPEDLPVVVEKIINRCIEMFTGLRNEFRK